MSIFSMGSVPPPLLLSEQQISQYLQQQIIQSYDRRLLLSEVNILQGATRIDHLVVSTTLHGIEIKSDLDDLQRLKRQIAQYLQVVEYLTIVATPQHLLRISRMLPDQVGLLLVYCRGERLHHLPIRESKANNGREPLSIAQLLWKKELIVTLREMGYQDRGLTTLSREQLWRQLATEVNLQRLNGLVAQRLRQRYGGHPAAAPALNATRTGSGNLEMLKS
ncbi:sce7726 family protein [Nostoc ellipsosporum NOK]|nr:sce7726 family protein [Nostoc ellipsosporum NOK]